VSGSSRVSTDSLRRWLVRFRNERARASKFRRLAIWTTILTLISVQLYTLTYHHSEEVVCEYRSTISQAVESHLFVSFPWIAILFVQSLVFSTARNYIRNSIDCLMIGVVGGFCAITLFMCFYDFSSVRCDSDDGFIFFYLMRWGAMWIAYGAIAIGVVDALNRGGSKKF
jgi:hypothetical protein